MLIAGVARAEESDVLTPSQTQEKYEQVTRYDIQIHDKLRNFTWMYGGQWLVYFATQHETIREHGSFQNWIRNPWHPEYDKDTFDYNLFKHAFSGQLYYQWYRSRGYTEQRAFLWSFISSMAFEETIETITEKPSLQDIYQTPVFGSLLGMGMERISLYFHSQKAWPYRVLGYLFNPFSILPDSQYKFVAVPMVSSQMTGVQVVWSFQ